MKRYLRDIQARAIVDLIWIPVRLGVRIRDRSLLWPCSLVQLRSHFPILGDQWSLLGGDAGKRSMASIWASWPFNPPSLPPPHPPAPPTAHDISAEFCVCSLAFIPCCSSLPCLPTSLSIVLFLTASIHPEVMLYATRPLSPGLATAPLIQGLPPAMLP